jgi:IS605 OrfB family transposase
MQLTTSIKLLVDHLQKQKLLDTMYRFNAASNFISEFAFANSIYNKYDLQKQLYRTIRDKFNLPSQFAIRAIARVADSYKLDKKVQRKFKKHSSVEYDARLLSWKKLEIISIATLSKRITVPIQAGQYAKLSERKLCKSAKLVYVKGEFYLQALMEVDEEARRASSGFLGVDLGIVNLATTSTGTTYSGEQVEATRVRYVSLRGRLQAAGSKSAKRHLKKVSGKERRFKRNVNHNISKEIVSEALRHNKDIALEELKGFRKTVRKSQKDKFGKWSYYELASYITYKALLVGIVVVKVDPRNTSRKCSMCSHCEKLNRKSQAIFKCRSCSHTVSADHNAAINIAARAAVNRLIVANLKVERQAPKL